VSAERSRLSAELAFATARADQGAAQQQQQSDEAATLADQRDALRERVAALEADAADAAALPGRLSQAQEERDQAVRALETQRSATQERERALSLATAQATARSTVIDNLSAESQRLAEQVATGEAERASLVSTAASLRRPLAAAASAVTWAQDAIGAG
jgi:chromosome segregation ATPase